MGDPDSFYAVLGLEPDADLVAVERAYRTLIKTHHPDREGGDPARATELNRAYRELRAALLQRDDVSLRAEPAAGPKDWSATLWAIVLLAGLGIAAIALTVTTPDQAAKVVGMDPKPAQDARVDVMEGPLNTASIDSAALEAVQMSKVADEMALSDHSNRCYQSFREAPSLDRLDRCAAFDQAVVRLQDRDPLRDRGRFSEIAVTGRLWSAAAALSSDYLATDSRLRQIRLHVELLLSPDHPNSADR